MSFQPQGRLLKSGAGSLWPADSEGPSGEGCCVRMNTRRVVVIAEVHAGSIGVTVDSYDGRARRRARHAATRPTASGDEDQC